jgi:hypothetical protein
LEDLTVAEKGELEEGEEEDATVRVHVYRTWAVEANSAEEALVELDPTRLL